jgi:site-specific DNA-methyltransferase (adenine-specific)
VLGRHRVVCGDAADEGAWAALLDDEAVDAVWTDPPYGVDYEGKTKDALKIENDGHNLAELGSLLTAVFTTALSRCHPGAAWYVCAPPGPATATFASVLIELDLFRQTLIWVKDRFVLGHSDYHYRHEIIYVGYGPKAPGIGRRGRGGSGWYGDNAEDSVLEVPRPGRNAEHPTMKPVELITRALGNSTRPGDVVADPFGGSGSTLIGCEQTGRTARLIELDPRYVDVIVARWEAHTGGMPVRVRPDGSRDEVSLVGRGQDPGAS